MLTGEARVSASGKPWASVRAFYSQGKDQTGEFRPSIWLQVKAFSESDEMSKSVSALSEISKGDKFTVKGRLGLEAWTTQSGEERSSLVIFANEIEPFADEMDEP